MEEFREHGAKSVAALLRRLTWVGCVAAGLVGSVLSGVTAFSGVTAAQAQDEVRAPLSLDGILNKSTLLSGIYFDEVARLAEEINFTTSIIFQEGRSPIVLLRDESGFVVVAQPVNCAGTALEDRCTGLLLYYLIRGNPEYRSSMINSANRYNSAQYYGSGHITAASNAVMIRMVLGDHGITRGQLATELFTARNAGLVFARVLGVRRVIVRTPDGTRVFAGPTTRPTTGGPSDTPGDRLSGPPSAFEDQMVRWRKLGLVSEILNEPQAAKRGVDLD